MQPYEVTASTVNEICPAIETWETGNRWLSKGKREEKIEAGEHRREEQDDKMARLQRKKVAEIRAHPRILRLYHKMAPTTSSASSSSRNTGMMTEAVPEREEVIVSVK